MMFKLIKFILFILLVITAFCIPFMWIPLYFVGISSAMKSARLELFVSMMQLTPSEIGDLRRQYYKKAVEEYGEVDKNVAEQRLRIYR